jgi:steroid delta-isomerase-like uncharacterized protein
MTVQEHNKALIRRWFDEVWNQGRLAVIEEMLASDGVVYGLSVDRETPMIGPGGFRPFFQKFRAAFSEIDIAVEQTIAEGDMVVARCTARGLHTGDSLGIPPTGRLVKLTGMVIARINGDKIAEVWSDFDFMALYQQIGAIEPR